MGKARDWPFFISGQTPTALSGNMALVRWTALRQFNIWAHFQSFEAEAEFALGGVSHLVR